MHNQQQHFQTNNIISKLTVIVLSIVLLTGLALVPALQIAANGQSPPSPQQPSLQKQVGLSQVIKQIAQQVVTANPGTSETHVQQILVQLAKQTAQTASQEQAIKEIRQIASQVATYPFGTVSQSLAQFAKQVASGTSITQITQQIIQEKSSTGKDVSGSVVTKAVQTATGANSNNINQVIRQAAQTLANAAGVPVEYVEAVIIQIALQISQAQGKAISGQTIFEIANQVAKYPNGVLAQAIIQLVKQYMVDNGKTGQTVNIINNVIKTGGSSSKTIVKVFEKPPPPPPKCPTGQHYDSTTRKCVDDTPPCEEDPTLPECEEPDPCEEDPTLPECEDPEPPSCEEDPTAEGCSIPTPPQPDCEENPNAEGCTPPPEEVEEEEAEEEVEEEEAEEEVEEEEASAEEEGGDGGDGDDGGGDGDDGGGDEG